MIKKPKRGFAVLDAEQRRAIAAKGGRAAHKLGTAHEFSAEEARVAGKKGGAAAHASGTAHKWDEAEARLAGSKGGEAAGRARREAAAAKQEEKGETL
jgi:general stress protein YciG